MTGKRIIWIAIGVLFAIVAMAAVAVPYWSGTQIEARLRELIAAGQPAGYATDIQSFDRGILQSKAMTRTRYRGPSGASLDLIFEHRIDHGPKLGQRALARIESTLRLAEGELANLRPALAGAAPLTIVTLIHADGSQDVDAWAPPFEVRDIDGQGGQLAFAGFSGRLEVAPDGASIGLQLHAPRLEIVTGGTELVASDIEARLHGVPAHTPMLWLGDGTITVRAISFEPVAREDLIPVSVDRLRLNYSLEGIDAGFDVKGGYAVKRVVLAGHSVDDLVLELNTGTYDRVAIMQYVETANRLQSAAAAQHSPQDAQAIVGAADELRESALRVLTLGRPTARLERVGFSYGGGRIDGNATVRYVGGVHARGLNPFTDFEGAFSLKGAKSTVKAIVAEFLARSQYGDRLASLPDEKRDAVTGATQFQLDAVSKNGMLKDTGDDYAVDATFKRGALRLNGVPVSLPGGTPAR